MNPTDNSNLFTTVNCTYFADEREVLNQQWSERCDYYQLDGEKLTEDAKRFSNFIASVYPNIYFRHVYPVKPEEQ